MTGEVSHAGREEGQPNDEGDLWLYRAMKEASDGLPVCAPNMLGIRIGKDVDVDADGLVRPERGGVSVTPYDPADLPLHALPKSMGGTGKYPVWRIQVRSFSKSLNFRPDPRKRTHGFIEPSKRMSADDYREEIESTRHLWEKVDV